MTLKDLWELAKTPMAAPESLSLKRMRIAWLCLCVMPKVLPVMVASSIPSQMFAGPAFFHCRLVD